MPSKKIQIIDYKIKQAENADTLDGKHASDFGSFDDVAMLQGLVGDTAVSDQIAQAINDSMADWEQYDETQPDYIKNRTHYSKPEKVIMSVSWDGNTEGLERIPDTYLYKVSDATMIYKEDATRCVILTEIRSGNPVIKEDVHVRTYDNYLAIILAPPNPYAYILYENNPFGCSPGTYFCSQWDDNPTFEHVSNLSYVEKGCFKALDEEYIPGTIARVSDIIPDTTLSTEGKPADAKATGDEIKNIKDAIGSASVPDQISQAITDHNNNLFDADSGELFADKLPIVPVEKGGTGANNPEEARVNLEITPANIGAAEAQATTEGLNNLSSLIGDTSVSEQISVAIDNSKSDWAQNDETKADYIKNRTHYVIRPEESEIISWDGNIDGLEKIHEENFYKVSDKVPYDPSCDFEYRFVVTEMRDGQDNSYEIPVLNHHNGFASIFGHSEYPLALIVYSDNPFGCSHGTYFNLNAVGRTLSLTSIKEERVKTIEEKFIPDTIARLNDIIPDTTLAVKGQPADAKATGDEFDNVKKIIEKLTSPVRATVTQEPFGDPIENKEMSKLNVAIDGLEELYAGFEITIIPDQWTYHRAYLSVNNSDFSPIHACMGGYGSYTELPFGALRPNTAYKLIYNEFEQSDGAINNYWVVQSVVVTCVDDLQVNDSGLAIEKGGTGAITAEEARTNLGVLSAQETTDELNGIRDLIGDTSVSEQISVAIDNSKSDWAQNDETKADYIKNRTHYTIKGKTTVINWDGNTEGLERMSGTDLYKVSDEIPHNWAHENEYHTIVKRMFGEGEDVSKNRGMRFGTGYAGMISDPGSDCVRIVYGDNEFGCSPGTYFISDEACYVSHLTFVVDDLVIELPEEYIPDTIARLDDIIPDTTLSAEGKPADAKATGDKFNAVMGLIGDTSVSDQINSAVAQKSSVQFITWEEND